MSKLLLCVTVCFVFISVTQGQNYPDDHDSSYYNTYRSQLTARVYLSRKYNVLSFTPPLPEAPFQYRATTSLNLGIGATYHAVSLNLGFGISKFNPNNEKGNTKYLDLQGHFYARKWKIDLLGEFYKGYYLTPQGLAAPQGRSYYIRPDIGLSLIGFAFYRSLNQKKFSYQAGLLQNEWQKKSAGSLIYGGEIYYGALHGDSSLVPALADPDINLLGINKFHFFSFGPGIGYAYTFVYQEHFFILGSASINLALRYSKEISTGLDQKVSYFGFRPNYLFHAGIGYNGDKWSLSLLLVDTELFLRGASSVYKYTVDVGNYRLVYAKRFNLDRRTKKILEPIPELFGN
jgi:hypothetical protein